MLLHLSLLEALTINEQMFTIASIIKMGNPIIGLEGKKFGRLTVTGLADVKPRAWECVCSCGNRKNVTANNLKNESIRSCGCLSFDVKSRFRTPKGESGFKSVRYNYRSNARVRGHIFDLTDEELRNLTLSDCHYCSDPPSQCAVHSDNGHTSEKAREHGKYIYNGLDRVDNDKGYVIGNVVPCCKTCNFAKAKIPYEDFINYLKRVADKWNPKT